MTATAMMTLAAAARKTRRARAGFFGRSSLSDRSTV
jgi:hypothetical protein